MNLNDSDTVYDNGTYFESVGAKYVAPVVWALIAVVGVVGNGLVLYVMLRYGDRKPTTLYIINLAVADIAFTVVVIPFNIAHFTIQQWHLSEVMCKFHNYIIYVTVHTTCFTLTAMTIDRYFAIVHPLSSMTRRTQRSVNATTILIWIVSLMICTPSLVFYVVNENLICDIVLPNHDSKIAFIVYLVSATYVMPLVVIITCYGLIFVNSLRRKRASLPAKKSITRAGLPQPIQNVRQQQRIVRLAKMVASIVSLFAICWLPIHIFNFWFLSHTEQPEFNISWFHFKIAALTLEYANSCLNPFVYAFMGDGFRRAVSRCFPSITRVPPPPPPEKSDASKPLVHLEPRSVAINDPIMALPAPSRSNNCEAQITSL